ncbi:MAG: extracellular solute-binding protein [Armatimonadetes bacterium]|nr:extracellular solute-binding protein [Armatimonadota bacterium]
MEFYDPNGRWDIPRVVFAVQKEHPELVVETFGGMNIPGLGWESMKAMAMAGRTGPDIMNVWIHQINTYVDQKLMLPLNEFIGDDTNGNGFIDDEEAKWEYWKRIPPMLRAMATVNGKVYIIPARYRGYNGLLIRRDLMRQAGINPDKIPKSWDEFYYTMQKLTDPKKKIFGAKFHHGQQGLALHVMPYYWYPWVWAAGGELVMQGKTNPKTHSTHWWPQEAYRFVDPETGDDLHSQPTRWKATFANEPGLQALDFYWKLIYAPWIKDPQTGEPVNLTDEQAKAGRVKLPDGRLLRFKEDDVINGVARLDNGQEPVSRLEMFEKGEVSIIPPGGSASRTWATQRPASASSHRTWASGQYPDKLPRTSTMLTPRSCGKASAPSSLAPIQSGRESWRGRSSPCSAARPVRTCRPSTSWNRGWRNTCFPTA